MYSRKLVKCNSQLVSIVDVDGQEHQGISCSVYYHHLILPDASEFSVINELTTLLTNWCYIAHWCDEVIVKESFKSDLLSKQVDT